jgi:hypothetical protein
MVEGSIIEATLVNEITIIAKISQDDEEAREEDASIRQL